MFFSRFRLGKRKDVSIDMMKKAVEFFGVDYNFMFGYPSIHDETYKEAINGEHYESDPGSNEGLQEHREGCHGRNGSESV
ncbi:hypothetical protein [Moorena sp. SIO3H5]|uniref:hypothetical protein n=1 Tax=Moorena sp. SIO3H5 TaxID=2607834 RepID=UPI0013BC7045|nr:hypothetical protein [Moorena sp. SIO3H5]NEO72149.1 hypothetical protein [Moorena sp. SIO3H5]